MFDQISPFCFYIPPFFKLPSDEDFTSYAVFPALGPIHPNCSPFRICVTSPRMRNLVLSRLPRFLIRICWRVRGLIRTSILCFFDFFLPFFQAWFEDRARTPPFLSGNSSTPFLFIDDSPFLMNRFFTGTLNLSNLYFFFRCGLSLGTVFTFLHHFFYWQPRFATPYSLRGQDLFW